MTAVQHVAISARAPEMKFFLASQGYYPDLLSDCLTLHCETGLTQASFLQKKSSVAKCFFDTSNLEIAPCHQKLDII